MVTTATKAKAKARAKSTKNGKTHPARPKVSGGARKATRAVAANRPTKSSTGDRTQPQTREVDPRGTLMDVPVSFGDVSIGDGTASIGVSIDRSAVNVETAEQFFCGRRLSGRILVFPSGDDPTQKYIPDTGVGRHEIESVFDCKRFGVSPKKLSTKLSFSLDGIALDELGQCAKRQGRLIAFHSSSLSEEKSGSDPGSDPEDGGQ